MTTSPERSTSSSSASPRSCKAYRAVVDGFKLIEPDVTVKLIEASDREDLLARLSTSFAGGTPPDLFLLNYRFYGQFAARDVLEPIESRLDDSDAFEQEDFYPQALEAFRFDGKLVCLPQNISSLVVYYNRDLFKQAKVPEPAEGWTWDDMVSKAIKLTRDTNGDGDIDQHGLGVEPSIIRIAPFVWSNGGELVDDEEAPTRFALDTPEATEAMQKFFDLRREHLVIPSEQEVEAEDDETRFQNGREAMVLSSRRATPTFRTITAFDWDVAPLPRHERAGGNPPQRRLLHDQGLGEQGRGVGIHGVRARRGGAAHHRAERPHGALAEGGRAVERVPRPVAEACELARSSWTRSP